MMEITIGNKMTFAVSLALNKNYHGVWLYGKFCYWINNQQIGDYELGTSLRDVLPLIKWLVFDNGNRFAENLCYLSKEDVFYNLSHALHHGEEKHQIHFMNIVLPDSFARFNIKMDIDIFDQWEIYLVDCKKISRVLFKEKGQRIISEYYLGIGEFDHVIQETYTTIDTWYENSLNQ